MSALDVLLMVPPGAPSTTPNREGASGLGSSEPRPGGFRYAPHTTAQCAAVLREAGYSVRVIDAPALGLEIEACLDQVASLAPSIVAAFVSWATQEADAAFLASLRARADGPALSIAFGNGARWIDPDRLEVAHILLGEPDLALAALCRHLLGQEQALPKRIAAQELLPEAHTPAGLIADLNALPPPAWDLLEVGRYDHLSVLASRGCAERCAWCPYVVSQGRQYRARSVASVVLELALLVRAHGPERIIFRDPVFALDPQRATQLCLQIVRHPELRPGRNLKWECESRPDHFPKRLLRLMSLAGCIGIKVGLETTSEALLARHGRAALGQAADYLGSARRLARDCAALGIACRAYALIGLPGQTEEMAQETARFALAMRPTALSIKTFLAYPGVRAALDTPLAADELARQLAPLQAAQGELAREPQARPTLGHRLVWHAVQRLARLSKRGAR